MKLKQLLCCATILLSLLVYPFAHANDAELQQRIEQKLETLLKELDTQMATPNTVNRVKTQHGWTFRCWLTNNSDNKIWIQVWQGENILHAYILHPHSKRVVWLYEGHYMMQYKKIGAENIWAYKGWRLDGKAAYIADETLTAFEYNGE